MRPTPHTTPLAQPLRSARSDLDVAARLGTPRRWDQISTRDRVLLSLLLRPDRDMPRTG